LYFDESTDTAKVLKKTNNTLGALVDSEYPRHLLLTSFLMETNRDIIMKKAGMLTENDKGKDRSKKELKERIKNYLKGVKNA
jgi:hypothetical protein